MRIGFIFIFDDFLKFSFAIVNAQFDIDNYQPKLNLSSYIPSVIEELFLQASILNSSAMLVYFFNKISNKPNYPSSVQKSKAVAQTSHY